MPRLTDTEKQEILRFVEADKPLPDKYRFLLFDDKREVELVWNGKTNEVCNIVAVPPFLHLAAKLRHQRRHQLLHAQLAERFIRREPANFRVENRMG